MLGSHRTVLTIPRFGLRALNWSARQSVPSPLSAGTPAVGGSRGGKRSKTQTLYGDARGAPPRQTPEIRAGRIDCDTIYFLEFSWIGRQWLAWHQNIPFLEFLLDARTASPMLWPLRDWPLESWPYFGRYSFCNRLCSRGLGPCAFAGHEQIGIELRIQGRAHMCRVWICGGVFP